MCGIAGFFLKKDDFDYEYTIESMIATLDHRGPDDKGSWFDKSGIALGQTRLSIIDLSPAGHQPMSDETKEIWIVFNGEIYNYLELQDELKKLGYKFKSRCDTEVIIYAYKAWGEKCFERFNGMFAVAIWDRKNERLVLARDRLGKKPLYYYDDNGRIAFASELKALLRYPLFKKEIDESSMYLYFTFGCVPAPGSIYKNTYKLEAGHYLVFENGRIQDHTYWDAAKIARKSKLEISFEEASLELERLIKSSVEYRLISDVKLGAFLSGGIDSSMIVAMMSAINKSSVKTFTIGFHDQDFNEAQYAMDIAKYLGTEHYEMYVKPQDCFDVIKELPEIYDEPFSDSSAIPTYLVSKITREHVTVTLSGDGGDELFGGYNSYRYMNRLRHIKNIPAPIKSMFFGSTQMLVSNKKYNTFLGYLKQKEFLKVYEHLMSTFRQDYIKKIFLRKSNNDNIIESSNFWKAIGEASGMQLLETLMLVDIKNYMVDDILVKVDRASMANSLEARVPLLDYRIVEFALRLPLQYKFYQNESKRILKDVLYKYIPKNLIERPKRGFGIPISSWLKNDLKYLVDNYLNKEALKKQGLFDYNIVSDIVKNHMDGRYNNVNMIWSMLMFQMWFDRYIESI